MIASFSRLAKISCLRICDGVQSHLKLQKVIRYYALVLNVNPTETIYVLQEKSTRIWESQCAGQRLYDTIGLEVIFIFQLLDSETLISNQ